MMRKVAMAVLVALSMSCAGTAHYKPWGRPAPVSKLVPTLHKAAHGLGSVLANVPAPTPGAKATCTTAAY